MPDLKPGEYVGADGMIHRAHLHHSVEHGEGWWWPDQDRVLPDDPDFPAAVEALKALVPEPFEWESDGFHYRLRNGVIERQDSGTWRATSRYTDAFNAGRRYERERGQ